MQAAFLFDSVMKYINLCLNSRPATRRGLLLGGKILVILSPRLLNAGRVVAGDEVGRTVGHGVPGRSRLYVVGLHGLLRVSLGQCWK